MYSKFYFFGLNHEPINNVENFNVYFNDTISWYRTDIRNIEASPDLPRVVCCRRRASLARQAYGDESHLPELVWVPPPHSDWSTSERVALSVVHVAWTELNSSSEHTIRYDTRCYFNVRSKADISQLNLPHGTDNKKSVKTEKKLKSKKDGYAQKYQ